jgi:hypothetical protein
MVATYLDYRHAAPDNNNATPSPLSLSPEERIG